MTDLENRVMELEAKVSFQDDTIDTLNDELQTHQKRLAKMQRQIELIGEKMKETSESGIIPQHQEPPPPHY
ncbi:SlyX family protein [Pseudoalteromonas aurantia]|uniref:Protein SlyX homolog n=1 Tax=Pseudoalteromonas aurantia 208 TaxID=1314867 RepID=A0ABR9E6A6_9GAMM|nr:SlyX family protein [Pseudoalteromonas aurantia]MBE0366518.1 SlyX protein [Pseudoalteromonas aurantia 208]